MWYAYMLREFTISGFHLYSYIGCDLMAGGKRGLGLDVCMSISKCKGQ
jgi:hypothetical protein